MFHDALAIHPAFTANCTGWGALVLKQVLAHHPVESRGTHLEQMYRRQPVWKKFSRAIVWL